MPKDDDGDFNGAHTSFVPIDDNFDLSFGLIVFGCAFDCTVLDSRFGTLCIVYADRRVLAFVLRIPSYFIPWHVGMTVGDAVFPDCTHKKSYM